jgi:alpha-methylacyl-CoA racemase
MPMNRGGGALQGLRIVEMDAIGPVPFVGMMLADFGADVVRIARAGGAWSETAQGAPVMHRSRRRVALDLKSASGRDEAMALLAAADAVIEGFRPGVMERLGLGPEACLAANPRLVYGRMTGWGQSGPRAQEAGHDINYLALSGALDMIGPAERPMAPLNLAADYAGGALVMAFGLMAALHHAQRTGQGQVVDCAMTDGVAGLVNLFQFYRQSGQWTPTREANLLDGGAPFYAVYPCSDGRFVAVGCIEPQFFAAFIHGLKLDFDPAAQMDRTGWPELRARIAAALARAPQQHWAAHFAGTDACVTPVLTLEEAVEDPHMRARAAHLQAEGLWQGAPAPKLSRTPAAVTPRSEARAAEVLAEWAAPAAPRA